MLWPSRAASFGSNLCQRRPPPGVSTSHCWRHDNYAASGRTASITLSLPPLMLPSSSRWRHWSCRRCCLLCHNRFRGASRHAFFTLDSYFDNGEEGRQERALPYLPAGRENPQPGSGPTLTSIPGSGPGLCPGPALSPGSGLEPGSGLRLLLPESL